jgi:hypothetical protein
MANVHVTIDSVGDSNSTNDRTATYSEGNGNPGWSGVAANGDVDLSKNGAQPNVNIIWVLPTNFLFDATTPFSTAPVSTDFSVTSGAGTNTLTIRDSNNDTSITDYQYTLHLSDGTKIDPKVINH